MKELSIEEKAKRYDEIIKKANKMHSENCETCQMCIEELIPELAESEDERIRKALIEGFNKLNKSAVWYNGITNGQIIAWLEKQSKASKVEQAMREVAQKAAAFTESHKGETSEEILAQMRGGQNPAWSEDDETKINYLIALLQNCTMNNDALRVMNEGIEDWLKSLKNRVLPQPKQEWKQENIDDLTDFENAMMHIGDSFFGRYAGLDPNDTNAIKEQANILLELLSSNQKWNEEDESFRIQCLDLITHFPSPTRKIDWTGCQNWIKSLKERYTWKPSEEQLNNILDIISFDNCTPKRIKLLESLYIDLEKLKGE